MASSGPNVHHEASPDKPGELKMTPKKYTYQDYLDLVCRPSMYSSVGKMTLSTKPSAPAASFGSARRDVNVFQSKELSKNQFKGTTQKIGLSFFSHCDR